MAKTEPDRMQWRGQRPWYEIWFACVLDQNKRRALWLRQTIFVPKTGDPRATIWGAWFDADAKPATRAAKRVLSIDAAKGGDGDDLIRTDDSFIARSGAKGQVENLAWDAKWSGGRNVHAEVPSWLPAPTHVRSLIHDADATASVTVGGETHAITGKAIGMHLWGKRRVPTLQWIWAPWLGDASLEVQAISLRDRFALGLATLRLDGPKPFSSSPATAAHPHGLITATVAGARRLVHVRAWAEPRKMVGYAYRDTDDRDLMVAQSDIGSAHYEVFARTAPGTPWKPVEERRTTGGVAVEIHQRTALPEVNYLGWDDTTRQRGRTNPQLPVAPEDLVAWPDVHAIVALGLTYADHVRETGGKIDPATPPGAFAKHLRSLVHGSKNTPVPDGAQIRAALDEVEAGLGDQLAARLAFLPAVMDYEGELALVALGAIDEDALARGEPQPFGLAAANDLTARLCQVCGEGTPRPLDYWAAAKSFARFLPVAERVWSPAGGIAKIPELAIETRVNGELRQQASTSLLIYDLATIVRTARIFLGRPLAKGDVILTGTPAGVGLRLGRFQRRIAGMVKDRLKKVELLVSTYASSSSLLHPGDVVEVDIGHAGRVRTRLAL